MKKQEKIKTTRKNPKKGFDKLFGRPKRGPGRPGVRPSEIRGRADHFRILLGNLWENIREPLLKAQSESDVIAAFHGCGESNSRPFVPGLAGLILQIFHEKKFLKRPKPQLNFLADSLAGVGEISPRRSRDICAEERAKDVAPSPYEIIRQELYVECTCGYKGPAMDNACRKCRAPIPFYLQPGGGRSLL